MKKFNLYLIFSIVVVFAYCCVSLLQSKNYPWLEDVIYLIAPISAFIVGLFLVRKFNLKSYQGWVLFFLVLGMFVFTLGELSWAYLFYVERIEPYPSIADVFFLGVYPISLIGLLIKIKAGKFTWSSVNFKKYFIFPVISFIVVTLVVYFGIYSAYVPEDNYASNIVSMLYGVGDLILICACFFVLIITIEYKKGKMFFPWLLITLSYSVLLVADVLFSANRDIYDESVAVTIIIDLIWIAGYFIFGLGMIKFLEIIESQEKNILKKLKAEKSV